jgi:hypothetical protein
MMRNLSESLTFTVPLSSSAHHLAEQFRRQQSNQKKAKQVYLNTLAVSAVNFYLRCMGIETNWEASQSRNPVMLSILDVADLEILNLGKLECRPVLPQDKVVHIPLEVWSDRIGYVAVQFDQSLKQATLLGFSETAGTGELPISDLRSLEDLLEHLRQLEQPEQVLSRVNLSQWFENVFEAGWRTIDDVFVTRGVSLVPEFRGTTRFRGKTQEELIEILYTTQDEETRWQVAESLWQLDPNNRVSGVRRVADLGMQLAGHAVALMVAVLPKPDQSMAILLRVYPMGSKLHLPPGLQLIGLDEAGNSFSEVQAREQDNYIQFKFTAELGDRFSLRVALDDASITESFVI